MNVLRSKYPNSDTIADAFDGFQKVAEALPCSVWIAGLDGKLEWCNDDFLSFTGITLEVAVAEGWISNIHPDDRQSIERDWARALAAGTQLDAVARLRGFGAMYRWCSVRARPFHDENGEIAKWLGTLTDIHDRGTITETNTHLADALMKGYLSKKVPIVKGLTFDTYYRAANMERVGGDWYDVFELPDGRIAFRWAMSVGTASMLR